MPADFSSARPPRQADFHVLCERFLAGEIAAAEFVASAHALGCDHTRIASELRRGRIDPSFIGLQEFC